MFDFDPRDVTDSRDRYGEDVYDPRWGEDPRDRDEGERDTDSRDRDPAMPLSMALSCRVAWNASWCRTSGSICTS